MVYGVGLDELSQTKHVAERLNAVKICVCHKGSVLTLDPRPLFLNSVSLNEGEKLMTVVLRMVHNKVIVT